MSRVVYPWEGKRRFSRKAIRMQEEWLVEEAKRQSLKAAGSSSGTGSSGRAARRESQEQQHGPQSKATPVSLYSYAPATSSSPAYPGAGGEAVLSAGDRARERARRLVSNGACEARFLACALGKHPRGLGTTP